METRSSVELPRCYKIPPKPQRYPTVRARPHRRQNIKTARFPERRLVKKYLTYFFLAGAFFFLATGFLVAAAGAATTLAAAFAGLSAKSNA